MIRNAKQQDSKRVFTLAGGFSSPTKIDQKGFDIAWHEKMRDERSFLNVAELDGELVGYAAGYVHTPIYANGSTFWLDEILVEEKFREQGIGRLLMDSVDSFAASMSCKQILLASSNTGKFYESVGFSSTAKFFKKYL